tara:strand:- start:23 stop:232 length:210 start_codon:yes stop_codon:yes gene_type:complete
MIAKEKAKELWIKMLGTNAHYLNKNIETDKIIAKQCALVCVDEILNGSRLFYVEDYDYWKEVEQEINKL